MKKLFYNLIDWKKNYVGFRSTVSFDAMFDENIKLDSLKTGIFLILSEHGVSNYYFENTNVPLTKEAFFKRELEPIEIYPYEWKNFQEMFIGSYRIGITYFPNSINLDNINSLVARQDLWLATLGNWEYKRWQNNSILSSYKYRYGLKIVKDTESKEKYVDISNRPGRSVYTKRFEYYGASKLWFGPKIYPNIPKDLILEFKEAIEIKELDNDVIYVNLYEGIFDGFTPFNQEIQRKFREHIKIDEIRIE